MPVTLDAQLPPAFEKVAVVRRVMPDLFKQSHVLRTARVVWSCAGVDRGVQNFLACVTNHEGGSTYWDVMFGGARLSQVGLPPGNAVLDPWQVRPGWVLVYLEGGTYREDSWTWFKARVATHPHHAPGLAFKVYQLQGRAAWATQALC